jgi:hypothetical protein
LNNLVQQQLKLSCRNRTLFYPWHYRNRRIRRWGWHDVGWFFYCHSGFKKVILGVCHG